MRRLSILVLLILVAFLTTAWTSFLMLKLGANSAPASWVLDTTGRTDTNIHTSVPLVIPKSETKSDVVDDGYSIRRRNR